MQKRYHYSFSHKKLAESSLSFFVVRRIKIFSESPSIFHLRETIICCNAMSSLVTLLCFTLKFLRTRFFLSVKLRLIQFCRLMFRDFTAAAQHHHHEGSVRSPHCSSEPRLTDNEPSPGLRRRGSRRGQSMHHTHQRKSNAFLDVPDTQGPRREEGEDEDSYRLRSFSLTSKGY